MTQQGRIEPTDLYQDAALDSLTSGSPTIELSDLGNARRLVAEYGVDFLYAPERGQWLVWDERRWKPDITGEVHRRAKQITDGLLDEARTRQDEKLFGFGVRSQSESRLRAMVLLAQTEPGIPVLMEQLDADPWLLAVANGTLDLRTGQLYPHRRSDLITKIADVPWEPDAICPTFDQFIARILPDVTVAEFVQRATGYSLTGDVSEQVLFIEYGTGSNGKSTLKEVQLALLGEHAKPAAPKLLLAKTHDAHPTGIADLHGRRMVMSHEIEEGLRLDEALVKELTGTDTLKARFMRQDFFDFVPNHKLWLACNHKPGIRGTDHGVWRRIRLIPFDVTIGEDERDRHLLDKLLSELPGILRWAVDGCMAWQQQGLDAPQAVLDATETYRIECDLVSQFIADRCLTGQQFRVGSTPLYSAYRSWCGANGLDHPLSQKAVAKQLVKKGYDRTTNRAKQVIWAGIGLIGCDEPLRGSEA